MKKKPLIVGVGSAIVDLLIEESDEFVAAGIVPKGGQLNVEWEEIEKHLKRTSKKVHVVPGGSACNTTVGIGRLGARTRFVSKCGDDGYGRQFEDDLTRNNVEPSLKISHLPTGNVLSIVTPDAQRTMYTCMGASGALGPDDLDPAHFKGAVIVHVEGYLMYNEPSLRTAMDYARCAKALISLDMGSFTVVQHKRELVEKIIDEYVDILLTNEDEARVLTGFEDEEKSALTLGKRVDIAAVKMGRRGSLIAHKGKLTKIGIMGSGDAIDTTGAGDLWNAGFLYGIASGFSMEDAGRLGAACGYEAVQVIGPRIPDAAWRRIKKRGQAPFFNSHNLWRGGE